MITVSDSRTASGEKDVSGDAIVSRLRTLGTEVTLRRTVPDDPSDIRAAVRDALNDCELIVLTGGTGIGPRDVTPQAVAPLLDYELPGMAEAMRREGLRHTSRAMLSRQVAGVSQRRLVLALPGSPRAVEECLDAVWDALPHALALLRGDTAHTPGTHPSGA